MTIPLSDRIISPLSLEGEGRAEGIGGAAEEANRRGPFDQCMVDFYERVDAEVNSHAPICRNRGLCCKFASYGHRMFVTEPERAFFARGMAPEWRPVSPDQTDCPYHVGGVCTARTHRPLGCRVFFCDESAQEWQGPIYERFLTELKQIGQDFDMPYAYREWLSALAEGPPSAA